MLTAVAAGCRLAQSLPEPAYRLPGPAEAVHPPRVWRELTMNSEWRYRSFSELVAERGQPLLLMELPDGAPPGFAAVYGIDPVSGCIEAFALLDGPDPIISSYECR